MEIVQSVFMLFHGFFLLAFITHDMTNGTGIQTKRKHNSINNITNNLQKC